MLEPNTPPRLSRRRRPRSVSAGESRSVPKPESSRRDLQPPAPRSPRPERATPSPTQRQGTGNKSVFNLRNLFSSRASQSASATPLKPGLERSPRLPAPQPPASRAARVARLGSPQFQEPASERIKPFRPAAAPSPATPPRSRKARRPRRPASPLLHVVRLAILGVGIGAIAGTLLSVLDPASRQGGAAQLTQSSLVGSQTTGGRGGSGQGRSTASNGAMLPVTLQLGEQMTPLATTIQAMTAQSTGLTPGVFLVDMDNGAYLDLNGTSIFSAASMIKVPILVAFFQDVDAGKIRLDELITMREQDIGSGSGEMQYQPPGTKFTALETAFKMITISDNTATNMLIARLGGAEALNRRFQEWGLTNTVIRNALPDLEGTNTTTPKELVELMARVSQGDLVSLRSRDRMLEIMRRTVTNTLLPAGLDAEATIAHKTGDIGSLVGDVGLIDAPNGKRYIATVMVQRPHNDDRAQELIRQISRAAYEYITQPADATTANALEPVISDETTAPEPYETAVPER